MDRLIYLIKTPLPGGQYARGYAERVRSAETGFRAEAIAVPVAELFDAGWAIRAHRLADREFTGFCHRVPAPGWFASPHPLPAAAPFADGCDRPLASPCGPPEILRRRAARHLHTTALGNWCAHPEIRMALAQDRLAAALSPALAMPDFLTHEDELFPAWKEARPEAAVSALADAEAVAAADGGSGEARRTRWRLRLAALRRIDAAALGREVFVPCPEFFGEPYLPFAAPGGWPLKAGRVRTAHYWPAPESEARSRAARADQGLIWAVEHRLCPWLPVAGGAGDFERAWAAWRSLAPLRDFECRCSFPLFPHRIRTLGYRPPEGYSVRIREATLAQIGGSVHTLAAAGLCPFIADPFRDHCAREAALLEAWAEDLPGSAAAKWAHCLS